MDIKESNRQAILYTIRKLEETRGTPAALAHAIRFSVSEEVKRLIANGADVNAPTHHGTTPLMFALNRKVARILVEQGADVNARDPEGRTPLICYLMMLDSPARAEAYVKYLLKAGADPSIAAHDGTTAYDLAREKYGPRVADLLIPPASTEVDSQLEKDKPSLPEADGPIVGGSWTYYCPYNPDAQAALQKLREDVFRRREYSLPGDVLAGLDDKSLKDISPDVAGLRKMIALAKGLDEAFADIGADTSDSTKRTREMETFIDKIEQEGFASAAKAFFKEKTSKKPQSIDEALELAEEAGTHSILDIDRIGDTPGFGVATPLSQAELIELFGTTEPTLEMAQDFEVELQSFREPGMALYFPVYGEGKPVQYAFAGSTGD
ncbi:MAG: ankyrin repeat domain-containing protein [Thermoguttaceae bacterium]